jgi:hypothetical protein
MTTETVPTVLYTPGLQMADNQVSHGSPKISRKYLPSFYGGSLILGCTGNLVEPTPQTYFSGAVGQFAEVECKEFSVMILANIKTFAHVQELIAVKQERCSG